MGKITYDDKDKTKPTSDPRRQWQDGDANEVKAAVNLLYDNLAKKIVDTSGATVILDFEDLFKGSFVGSAAIAAPKALQFDNDANAVEAWLDFTLSGLHPLTFPTNVKMSDPFWNGTTKIWTPLDIGEFEMEMKYNGTIWKVKIFGPF